MPLYVIGVGTLAGGMLPIVKDDETGEEGSPGRSRLDRASLQRIAAAGGGQYFELDRDPDGQIANRIIDAGRRMSRPRPLTARPPNSIGGCWSRRLVLASIGLLFLRERTELWMQLAGGVAGPGLTRLNPLVGSIIPRHDSPRSAADPARPYRHRGWGAGAAPVSRPAVAGAARRGDAGHHRRLRIGDGDAERHHADHHRHVQGLKTPATVARLHRSRKPAMRGAAIGDLKATRGTSGTITGSIELTQGADRPIWPNGRLYIQLHSEKAPDGNLWGWLLPQEGKK